MQTFPIVPAPDALAVLLDRHARFTAPPLVPEVRVFQANSLVEVWEAAEALAGEPLPSPFWAYAWPAGIALARLLLDRSELVRGRHVLDIGAGGGVSALAAARAGAARVVANDVDPWAVAVARIAADRQALLLETHTGDLTRAPLAVEEFDLVLASDLAYERHTAPQQRALLEHARATGAEVLIADAGRTYFDDTRLEELTAFDIAVPQDLEGVATRRARVFRMA